MRVPVKSLIFSTLFLTLIFPCAFLQPTSESFPKTIPKNANLSYEGIMPSLNFTEYATSQNSSLNFPISDVQPRSAYFDVPPRWQTDELNLTVTKLSENRTWTNNTDYDSGASDWTYHNVTYYYPYWKRVFERPIGGWVGDSSSTGQNCTFVVLNGTRNDTSGTHYYYVSGQEGRWEQKINIPRGEVLSARIECDLYIEYAFIDPSFEIFFTMDSNNNPDQMLMLTDFRDLDDQYNVIAGRWFHVQFDLNQSMFDFSTYNNNTIYFSYGLSFFRSGYVIAGFTGYNAENQTVYFDNVNLDLVTRAFPSDVNLSITTNGVTQNVNNISWGVGNILWDTPLPSVSTPEITTLGFLFTTNATDCWLDWTIIANGSTITPTTFAPVDPYQGMGEDYKGIHATTTSSGPVEWDYYLYANAPTAWKEQYHIAMNISLDWSISSIENPNYKEIVDYLLGGHGGDGFFAIGTSNASKNGFWRVKAQSPNYAIRPVTGGLQPDSIYMINTPLQVAVNCTQSTGIPENLLTSVGNLSLYHPNGSIYWDCSCTPDGQAILNFSTILLGGTNTSAGRYIVHYSWTNGTALAFNATTIIVQHATHIDLILPSNFDPDVPLPSIYTSTLALRVELWDTDANLLVSKSNVTFKINGQSYRFNEVAQGVYDINFDTQLLSQPGKYDCSIHVDGIGVTPDDLSFQVDIYVPQTMTWILIGVITALIAGITAVVVRAKVIMPNRARAHNELMEITSHYYDAHALVGYIVLYKRDGLAIFDQWQDLADKKVDANLISGFLTAITVFGEQLPMTRSIEDFRNKKNLLHGSGPKYRMMSLDYQDFVILLLDGQFVRVATIFASKPSEYFESRLRYFVEEFEEMYGIFLIDFSGAVDAFDKADGLFNKYVHFHLTRPIGLAESTHAKKSQKNVELTDGELRMNNVIQTFLREKDYVRLRTVASLYATATKEEELTAIKGIMGLWFKGMLEPIDPEESLETALRFFSQEDAEILKVIASGTLNHDIIATEVKMSRNAVDAKLQSFRAWKLINLRDQVTEKGRILLERRMANKK